MTWFVWIWLAIAVIALFVEAMTTEVVSIWFFFGSVVSMILAIFEVDEIIQCWVFIGVSVLFLVCVRPFLKKWLKRNEIKTNIEAIVGKTAIVISDILLDCRGEVKLDGIIWTAISSEELKTDQSVVVLAIEGNKLIVKGKDNEEKNLFKNKGE